MRANVFPFHLMLLPETHDTVGSKGPVPGQGSLPPTASIHQAVKPIIMYFVGFYEVIFVCLQYLRSVSLCFCVGFEEPCPVAESVDASGCLLASGGRDRTVRVWSTLTSKSLTVLRLPSGVGQKRERYEEQAKSRVWLTLHWPKDRPRQIVSSCHG